MKKKSVFGMPLFILYVTILIIVAACSNPQSKYSAASLVKNGESTNEISDRQMCDSLMRYVYQKKTPMEIKQWPHHDRIIVLAEYVTIGGIVKEVYKTGPKTENDDGDISFYVDLDSASYEKLRDLYDKYKKTTRDKHIKDYLISVPFDTKTIHAEIDLDHQPGEFKKEGYGEIAKELQEKWGQCEAFRDRHGKFRILTPVEHLHYVISGKFVIDLAVYDFKANYYEIHPISSMIQK